MPQFPTSSGRKLSALLSVALVAFVTVNAATLTVTTTADAGAGSLRDAIASASDGDIIQFADTLNGQTIILTSAEFAINKDIRITGPGPSQLKVERSTAQGTPNFRIFHILPGRTVTIEGLTISRGGNFVDGCGLLNDHGTLTIDRCAVQGNFLNKANNGGGLYNAASGGSATLTILNSTITGNNANSGGGGIYNDGSNGGNASLTILSSVVTGNRVFNSSIQNPGGDGGGIYNDGSNLGIATLTITKSIVSDNSAGDNNFANFPSGNGAGIYNICFNGTAVVTILETTMSGNRAGFSGGGITNNGVVTITSSTLSGNNAGGFHDGDRYGIGGGINNSGGLTIANSTLSSNNCIKTGGGVANSGSLTFVHSTLAGNMAFEGGGIYNYSNGNLHIGNTILSGPPGSNILNAGTVTSDGYNISNDNAAGVLTGNGDQINTDPMLAPLQNNGGPTATHGLLTGSPAIDTGDPNFTPPPLYDQRGPSHVRVYNARIDIGSLEAQPTPVPTPTATPTPTPLPTSTPSPTLTPTPTPSPTSTPSPTLTPTPTPSPTSTPSPTLTPTPTPPFTPASLGNISTRLRVDTGDNVLIGGFIITGNASKSVVLRGLGPSLAGLGLSDVLADPNLELRAANGALIFQNDDWQDNSPQASELSAVGLAPPNPKESGIVAELTPAAYTAILAGKNNSTGVGLVEIYDTTQGAGSHLGNISTRGLVRTGDHVMIGGFILGGGSGTNQIVVRGIGPSLAQLGLSPVLTDPTLELRNADGALLLASDDWQDNAASATELVSHNLAPQNPKESGIYSVLPPGAFTAILAGKNGGTGIGLVEIYNLR